MPLFAPGTLIAGHEILRSIGEGGYAEVFEVLDRERRRRALKAIKTQDAALAGKLRERLARECTALAAIDHPNVVRFYDAGIEDETVWLLLELVVGHNLRRALTIQREMPRIEAIVRWIRSACEGVEAAHRRGIVHRDLKPENILVAPGDVVKIIDFGVAKLHGWGVETTQEHRIGTALYMSPEHLQNAPADARMDVYSMGMVLYEAVAGAHPLASVTTLMNVVRWQLAVAPRPIRALAPDAPPALEAVIAQALEKDPARRTPSIRALSDGLEEVLSGLLAPRRRAARSFPAESRPLAYQVTAPMPAVGGWISRLGIKPPLLRRSSA